MEKILKVTLTPSGAEPSEPLCGGTRGEHRATALILTPDDELSEAILRAEESNGDVSVKFDVVTEAGEFIPGEEREPSAISEPFYLTAPMTASGLDAVVLVRFIVKDAEGRLLRELYKAQIRLWFEDSFGEITLPRVKKTPEAEMEAKAEELCELIEKKGRAANELLDLKAEQLAEQLRTASVQLKKCIEAGDKAESSTVMAEKSEARAELFATEAESNAKATAEAIKSVGTLAERASMEARRSEEAATSSEDAAARSADFAAESANAAATSAEAAQNSTQYAKQAELSAEKVSTEAAEIKEYGVRLLETAENLAKEDGCNCQTEPLFISMIPEFNWVSQGEIAAFSSSNDRFADGTSEKRNAYFKVTGKAGDNFVTVVSGGNAEISHLTDAEHSVVWGAVIGYDDGNYFPCNARYRDESSFYVYPVLKEDITDGELAQMQTGIHLSKRGYIAYAQHAFRANPKHCEKSKYIARFIPEQGGTHPFEVFGGKVSSGIGATNVPPIGQSKYAKENFGLSMAWGENYWHTTPTGAKWKINTLGKRGYVEAYIGVNNTIATASEMMEDLLDGEQIFVELWLDGVLSKQYVKKSVVCERICLDFENAVDAELRVYSNSWTRTGYGIQIGAVTWWVNEKYFDASDNPFKYKTITQLFDSWGVYHGEAVTKELERLNKELSGVYVPISNHSAGSKTSMWGRAWFYEYVAKEHPAVMITDFCINESTSTWAGSDTETGPDGTVYDDVFTGRTEYGESMVKLIEMALANNIQPIIFCCGTRLSQGNGAITWGTTPEKAWSKQIQ